MANEITVRGQAPNPVVAIVRSDKIQTMIKERLGKRAGQFTTSLISLANSRTDIAECKPLTVVQAALIAASMDLPINQNLGFAYIVPYKNRGVAEAQFQMGWKGFVQLAQRSGKFKTINTTDVREGEVTERDRLTGELKFSWINDDAERSKKPVVGYLAYFELLNGFSKSLYMTKAEIEKHADRYSQAYRSSKKGSSGGFKTPWETDFDLMAQKTVLKQLLSRFAPLSTEMQEAIANDQSVDDGNGRRYVDNDDLENEKADPDKKAAIIAANKPAGEADDEDPASPPPKDSGDPTGLQPSEVEQPEDPADKPTLKDKLANSSWPKKDGAKGKQTSLTDK